MSQRETALLRSVFAGLQKNQLGAYYMAQAPRDTPDWMSPGN